MFLFILCGRLSWLPVSFLLHVKYTLSYRRILSEKAAEPIVAKPEHKPSVLRKKRGTFSDSCPILNFMGHVYKQHI